MSSTARGERKIAAFRRSAMKQKGEVIFGVIFILLALGVVTASVTQTKTADADTVKVAEAQK